VVSEREGGSGKLVLPPLNRSSPGLPSLTPSFPLENDSVNMGCPPALTGPFVREKGKNPGGTQGVGWVGRVKEHEFAYIQPHNYRLLFSFFKETFSFFNDEKPMERSQPLGLLFPVEKGLLFPVEDKVINHGSELFIRFSDFSVRVKKSTIEVVNNVEHKRIYAINKSGSIDDVKRQVEKVKLEKESQTLGFLRGFVSKYGGKTDFKIIKRGDFLQNCDVSHWDKRLNALLPFGKTWSCDVAKKVYPFEKKVESFGLDYNANLIRNLMILDIAPFIAEELKLIKERLPIGVLPLVCPDNNAPWSEWSKYFFDNRERLNLDYSFVRHESDFNSDTLSFLQSRVHSIQDVMALDSEISVLSLKEKSDFTEWLFNKNWGGFD